jgi:hypothetical protein
VVLLKQSLGLKHQLSKVNTQMNGKKAFLHQHVPSVTDLQVKYLIPQ